MEQIDEKTFKEAKNLPLVSNDNDNSSLSEKQIKEMLAEMDNPVLAQKKIAIQIKHFLDNRIKLETSKFGTLSESTRKWVESYNTILEKLQRALHGDKSINLHVHKISHSDIATKIREVVVIGEKKNEENNQRADEGDD